ncbi:DUF5819 family protein [Streptomyces sp. NPDC002935]|uniref:DUF5819 family protein n=1 Tax=Streptomyces sp. NPDC002935 TaxID=3154545 RepID=UPI0033ABEFE8
MDANDEGSKPEPGPDALEGVAPERPEAAAPDHVIGGTTPPDEPAADESAIHEPETDHPTTEELAPDVEGTEPEPVVHVASDATEPEPVVPVVPEEPEAPAGLAALSLGYQIAAALALAVVAVVSCVHLGMVFLHVAPSNTLTKQHGHAIDEWIYPEFEQNWKLFAPNPLQQNIKVQVRAMVRTEDGTSRETGWYDLSALDGLAIDGNPLPSHTQQNELRRAWDFYLGTHDAENRPAGLRGDLSERYLRRIGALRLDREHAGGEGAVVERVQFRSLTTDVPPPEWSEEKVSDQPVVRELPWWAVPESDHADALTEASAR